MNTNPETTDSTASGAPKFEVIVGATSWTLNGVNIFSVNLVRGLRAAGIDAKILLTEENTALATPLERDMPRPHDIVFEDLPVDRRATWGAHWGAMIRYLERRAPCVYVPNSDWRHSCVNPLLSQDVRVVGVVHSDDPLHYDHVARLGKYWNGIVTTSKAIAAKVKAADSTVADRITTIPIGVNIPSTMPVKSVGADAPLRVIYHGVLKQYQKRIFDLPKIAAACAARGIRVEFTIAGGGPEEYQLREASRELVERGLIRFLGVVPHDDIFGILERHDVYILTSEFEGMPNALLEAMGRGCVPLVTDMDSGIPEVVSNGRSGFLVPIGDIIAFTERLQLLQSDVEQRREMAAAAHATVLEGAYRTEDMVRDYIKEFRRVMVDSNSGAYARPNDPINPPPAEVDGVSVFPIELTHREEILGRFPTDADAADFRHQVGLLAEDRAPREVRVARSAERRRRAEAVRKMNVVVATPDWTDSGINRQVTRLVQGLRAEGMRAAVLLTEERTALVSVKAARLSRATDIPIEDLPVKRRAGWGAHWGAMIRYLEQRRPCIYIPNHDWRHSCVSPRLSDGVFVVGVLHGDDPLHYDHVARLGEYWNGIVAGSEDIARTTKKLCPSVASRLRTIPYGADIAARPPKRNIVPEERLKVVCVCPNQYQEVVSSLADVRAHWGDIDAKVEFTLVDHSARRSSSSAGGTVDLVVAGSHAGLMGLFEHNDVIWVASHFDYMHEAVAEAMSRGCVPVVTAPRRSIPAQLQEGRSGFVLRHGDVEHFVNCLKLLRGEGERRLEMALQAYKAVARSIYRLEDTARAYMDLFEFMVCEAERGTYRRPTGRLQPPPQSVGEARIFSQRLTHKAKGVGSFVNRRDYRDFQKELLVR